MKQFASANDRLMVADKIALITDCYYKSSALHNDFADALDRRDWEKLRVTLGKITGLLSLAVNEHDQIVDADDRVASAVSGRMRNAARELVEAMRISREEWVEEATKQWKEMMNL